MAAAFWAYAPPVRRTGMDTVSRLALVLLVAGLGFTGDAAEAG
jgi:hypothetical protein